MSYAEGTSVPVEKSKAELDRMLAREGARQRLMGTDDERGVAFVVFALAPLGNPKASRQVRLELDVPRIGDFKPRSGKYARTAEQLHEQACRERWRLLVLLVKAMLEAIAAGITTAEREFLADVLLPDGKTVHRALEAGIAESYTSGTIPPLLGTGGAS